MLYEESYACYHKEEMKGGNRVDKHLLIIQFYLIICGSGKLISQNWNQIRTLFTWKSEVIWPLCLLPPQNKETSHFPMIEGSPADFSDTLYIIQWRPTMSRCRINTGSSDVPSPCTCHWLERIRVKVSDYSGLKSSRGSFCEWLEDA